MEENSAKLITCPECRKNFPSMKSLCGHMRSHPNREWRGIQPPSTQTTNNSIVVVDDNNNHRTDKIINYNTLGGCRPFAWTVTGKRGRKSTAPEPHMDEYVYDLMMLSLGLDFKKKTKRATNDIVEKPKNLQIMNKVESNGLHQCNLCNKTFPTGQALGGHMRRHWTPKNVIADQDQQETSTFPSGLDFDLNQPAANIGEKEDSAL